MLLYMDQDEFWKYLTPLRLWCGGGGEGEGEHCWGIWKDKHPANDISVLHTFILFGQNDYSFNSFTDWEG